MDLRGGIISHGSDSAIGMATGGLGYVGVSDHIVIVVKDLVTGKVVVYERQYDVVVNEAMTSRGVRTYVHEYGESEGRNMAVRMWAAHNAWYFCCQPVSIILAISPSQPQLIKPSLLREIVLDREHEHGPRVA